MLSLDITRPDDFDLPADQLRQRWNALDGTLHAVAFAPQDALAGDLPATSPDGINPAFHTSAISLAGASPGQRASHKQHRAQMTALFFAFGAHTGVKMISIPLATENRVKVARELAVAVSDQAVDGCELATCTEGSYVVL